MKRNYYLTQSLSQVPRLLGLLDRNPLSTTFGSFHRNFWLHRTSDFSSHIYQLGFHSLAILYNSNDSKNNYYQNKEILNLCEAGILFLINNQNKDGSFDEWYPYEHGWAGPTGYLTHALCDSYINLKTELSEQTLHKIEIAIKKASLFLINNFEVHVLTNHIAMALLPIYETFHITKEDKLLKGYNRLFEKFLTYCDLNEGWGLEYDGPDIGYQTATISFLARIHKLNGCDKIKNLVKTSLDFVSHFFYPNNLFSMKIGSRQTSNLFVYGIEYWAMFFESARKLSELTQVMISKDKLIMPEDHEDHYLVYRLPEFLEASSLFTKNNRTEDINKKVNCYQIPCEKDNFFKLYKNAGILISNTDLYYTVINIKRGGLVLQFDKSKQQLSSSNLGLHFKLSNQKILSTQFNDPLIKYEINDLQIDISGRVQYIKNQLFDPKKLILFRLSLLLLSPFPKLAPKMKALIRRMLMVGQKYAPIHFKRSIHFDVQGRIHLKDQLTIKSNIKKIISLNIGGHFETRFVPQSRYFQEYELDLKRHSLSENNLSELNKNKKLLICSGSES
jgi:hypothetical protein